jgi:biopolymer transport protein TolQ
MPETTPLTDLIPSASVAHHPSVIEMLFSSGPVVQAVLIILLLLSIFTWAITIAKYVQIRRARQDSDEFYSIFWDSRSLERVDDSCKRLGASPIAQIFSTGYREMLRVVDAVSQNRAKGGKGASTTDLDTIKRALVRSEANEFEKLEKGSTFLATVASAAPFIGLFGTVWGIMTAFQGLGTAKSRHDSSCGAWHLGGTSCDGSRLSSGDSSGNCV